MEIVRARMCCGVGMRVSGFELGMICCGLDDGRCRCRWCWRWCWCGRFGSFCGVEASGSIGLEMVSVDGRMAEVSDANCKVGIYFFVGGCGKVKEICSACMAMESGNGMLSLRVCGDGDGGGDGPHNEIFRGGASHHKNAGFFGRDGRRHHLFDSCGCDDACVSFALCLLILAILDQQL